MLARRKVFFLLWHPIWIAAGRSLGAGQGWFIEMASSLPCALLGVNSLPEMLGLQLGLGAGGGIPSNRNMSYSYLRRSLWQRAMFHWHLCDGKTQSSQKHSSSCHTPRSPAAPSPGPTDQDLVKVPEDGRTSHGESHRTSADAPRAALSHRGFGLG